MAKTFSVAVEIGGKLGASFSRTVDAVEGRLKKLSNSFKQNAAVAKSQASEISESYKGIAKLAAAGGIAFSVKHAFEGGEELAHELSNLKSAGRSAEEVAEGLRAANKTIADMPTATLTNSVKLLNETTGAYGDFKHAVENLSFNSKLGDVLKNVVGVEDPAHELGSIVKALEIRTSASNPERYKAEASKLGQAEVFYGGRLRSDQFRDFASNSTVGVKQLSERFLTRIAPALIQEKTGEKVGTGLEAFRTIISGRKITDKKQAEAWQKLGLLNQKDIIRNKMGDVTGWKDGAINATRMAYSDPLEFMEKVILPRLQKQGVDINDQVQLGQALNTLFKNKTANAFISSISTAADVLRLHKDEALMNGVLPIDEIYDSKLLNDPTMASFAIQSAMTNIGAALTKPLMKPFAEMMVSIARAINRLSSALIDHPEIASLIAKIGAAVLTWQAIRFANLAFGVGAFTRMLVNLSLASVTGTAARLVGISRAIVTFAMSGQIATGLRAFAGALYMVTLGAPAYLAGRLRSIAFGIMALQTVGGSRLVFSTLAGSLATFGGAILRFPWAALARIGGVLLGLAELDPVVLVVTAAVVALTALGVWVYNNWSGIITFFGAFGSAFMKALGPGATGAISKVVEWLGAAWRWIVNLLGPIDETGQKWKEWGEWAGNGVGTAVKALIGLPGVILDFASKAWHALVDFDWAAAGKAILSKIGGALGGVGGYLAGKLGFGGPVVSPPGTPLEARAIGGPVSSRTPYLVGENGPEIFVPSAAGKIETNKALKSMAAPAGASRGSDIATASRQAQLAAVSFRGLDTSVSPIVFTGSLDDAVRRTTKLYSMLDAINRSSIKVASLGGGGFGSGNGGGFPADGGGFGDGSAGGISGGGGQMASEAAKAAGSGPVVDAARAVAEKAGAASGAGALAVDLAEGMKGFGDSQAAQALGHYMHSGAWCADFVNGSLAKAGGKGTGNAMARSFFKWGNHVGNDGIRKGDVLVKQSHVGFATGAAQMHNGQIMIPMISGNHGHKVGEGWARLGEYEARRAAGGDQFASAPNAPGASQSAAEFLGPNANQFPAGMRNNNPGNLKFSGSKWQRENFPGMVGPSKNRDQGDPQIVFSSPQAGMNAMRRLLDRKFDSGKTSVSRMITDKDGWTPGNNAAAAAIAATMGVRPGDNINLKEPKVMHGFMRALMKQEHGPASAKYSDAMIDKTIPGASVPKAPEVAKAAPSPVKLAGARAMGGPVGAGLSYLVGERGPEIFTPGAAGGISTNDALGRLSEVGKAVTSGEGAESVTPSADRIARARQSGEEKPSGGGSRSIHAGEHHWHINGGGNPHEIRRQVEGCFIDLIRQMESAQSGSLSD